MNKQRNTTRPTQPRETAVRAAMEALENRQFFAADFAALAAAPGPAGGPATVTGAAGASIQVSRGALVFNAVRGQTSGTAKLTISNGGSTALNITKLTLGGTEPGSFQITSNGGLPKSLAAGASAVVTVVYKAPAGTALAVHTATLTIASNDASRPSLAVPLRGLATVGTGGQSEPSLQRLFDLYQLGVATGDKNAADTNLFSPSAPLGANDELTVQKLTKAGTGAVTVQALGAFAGGSPVVRFGYYTAGSAASKTELLTVNSGEAQTVSVNPVGSTTFDPGSGTFGLYATFPIFGNTALSEDNLNTGEATAANRRKVRFYPLKNADGSVVPNAYVFTSEDFVNDQTGAYDTNDFFGIVRNVKAANTSSTGGLVVQNLDGVPFDDRLTFSRIQVQPPEMLKDFQGNFYQPPNNVEHDVATVRLTNTKSTPVTINAVTLSNTSAWKITSASAAGTVLQPGQSVLVTVKFVATSAPATTVNETVGAGSNGKASNGTYHGTLKVTTSDAASNRSIDLAGYYQLKNEKEQEPNVTTLVNKVFGYTTTILGSGQSLAQGGRATAVGEEVLSGYWLRADTTQSVSVRQLAAYHTQGDTASLQWFAKGSGTLKTILTHNGVDAQSVLPRNTQGNAAAGTFLADGSFGFKVGTESSDDKLNKQEQTGGGFGHHVRFWPARDRSGVIIPNTYIMGMDYQAINYDFQDNLYLISNVKPANGATPTPTPTAPVLAGITLVNAATDADIKPFANNTAIDLSGGKQFTVEANPGSGTLGSVVFKVDGVVVRTETTPPYTIAGETNGTDHNPWDVPLGTHTLTVTPFGGPNGTGAAGPTITATFTASNGGTTPTPTPTPTPTAGTFSPANVNGATGSTAAAGTGAWTVKGSGTGIAGTKDQFHFAQQARTGDFDVKVKLSSLTAGGTAGLVARGDVSAGNSGVAILFSGGKVTFGSRASFGETFVSSQVGTGTAGNIWLRLQRVGGTFTAFFGTTGTTWTTAGTATVSALPAGLKFGFAVFSGGTAQATAGFTNAAG
jgi:hypothetical protein